MGHAARDWVLQHYPEERVVSITADYYRSLLETPPLAQLQARLIGLTFARKQVALAAARLCSHSPAFFPRPQSGSQLPSHRIACRGT